MSNQTNSNPVDAILEGDILNVDFSKVQAFGNSNYLNEPGDYEINVQNVTVETDTKDGQERTYLAFQFAVAEGEHEGELLSERVYLPNAYGKLKQILEVLGFNTDGQLNVRQLLATNALLGKPAYVTVGKQVSNDPSKGPRTVIKAWQKSKRLGAGTGLPGSGGAALPGSGGVAAPGGVLPGMPGL